jgi:CheY-like chemotaxis protein
VVEDDERQRDSIQQLLDIDDVRIMAVATATEALEQLQATTFDCMVMDLHLPDMSGFELLETMSSRDGVSFPPVIVYTGRSLSSSEEQRLHRFSKSIIVKDARSPERLLDESRCSCTRWNRRCRWSVSGCCRRQGIGTRRSKAAASSSWKTMRATSSRCRASWSWGATVDIARNGREAIDALARSATQEGGAIDLVLMDIMMPEMDGLTAMREIRKRSEWKKLPIIALTAKAMKDDQEKCLAAGANDYIAKPLDVDKLLSLVRVWMPK